MEELDRAAGRVPDDGPGEALAVLDLVLDLARSVHQRDLPFLPSQAALEGPHRPDLELRAEEVRVASHHQEAAGGDGRPRREGEPDAAPEAPSGEIRRA